MHLLQLWIVPHTKGLVPRWEQKFFMPEERSGTLLPVVSAGTTPGSLQIDQDATSFVSRLQAGHAVRHASRDGRHACLFVIESVLRVNGMSLAAGDQARIAGERTLRLEAAEDAEVILLDLP